MAGVNAHTLWTWNAIGKRRGAWNLHENSAEATKGFLLNHLIPDRADDGSANADPITGQAAWFDLRVRLEPVSESDSKLTEPQFEPIDVPVGLPSAPTQSRFGAGGNR